MFGEKWKLVFLCLKIENGQNSILFLKKIFTPFIQTTHGITSIVHLKVKIVHVTTIRGKIIRIRQLFMHKFFVKK